MAELRIEMQCTELLERREFVIVTIDSKTGVLLNVSPPLDESAARQALQKLGKSDSDIKAKLAQACARRQPRS